MPRVTRLAAIAVALVGIAGAACGDSDDASEGSGGAVRTVEVEMVDTAFEPKTLEVARGERVRFVFENNGKLVHDAFIGDAAAQQEHEKDMQGDAEGESHDHDGEAEEAVTVEPGKKAELTHTFDESGTIEIGCHQPGHYGAGMKVTVTVAEES